jgi:hypothetical protein
MRWHLRIDTVVGECRRTGHTPSASSSSAKQRADGSVDKRRISSLRSNHGDTATTGAALEHRNDTRARSTGLVVESEYPRGESRCNNHTGLVSWSCYGHLQSVCVCRLKHLPAASLGPGPAWLSSSCPDRSSSNSILHTKSHANTPGNATNSSISSSFPAACLVTMFTLAVALLNSVQSKYCPPSALHPLHMACTAYFLSSTHNACALFTLFNYNSFQSLPHNLPYRTGLSYVAP